MWTEAPPLSSPRSEQVSGGKVPTGPFLVIANPGSGAHDAQQTRELLTGVFAQAGRAVEFISPENPQDLVRASQDAAARASSVNGVVVAVGGDGTINTVARAALDHCCALGVIPQGTFNLFARNYGIAQDAEAAARALVRATPRPIQVGWLNDQLFLVNASLGLYPQLLEDREAWKAKLGRYRWVALLSALRTLFAWRGMLSLEIEFGGEVARVRTPTLFVGNNLLQLQSVGLPAEAIARVGEGRMAAIVVTASGRWPMLMLLLRGAAGRLGDAHYVDAFAFSTLQVTPRSRLRAVRAAVDGEVVRVAPPLRFAVSTEPLLLMMPRTEDQVPA